MSYHIHLDQHAEFVRASTNPMFGKFFGVIGGKNIYVAPVIPCHFSPWQYRSASVVIGERANEEFMRDAKVLASNCGCGLSDCESCAPKVTVEAGSYGDEYCWTPPATSPEPAKSACDHDWRDSATVKGKTKWCRKCGERE